MSKYKCSCNGCEKKFDENEYKLTQDKDSCILHCKKDNWVEYKILRYFWTNICSLIEKASEKENCNELVFQDIIFPVHEKEIIYKPELDEHGITIKDNMEDCATNFYFFDEVENNINKAFDKFKIRFDNCTFLSVLDLEKYDLTNELIFKNSSFKNGIKLNENFQASLEIDNYISEGTLLLQKIVFKKPFVIKQRMDNIVAFDCNFEGYFELKDIEKFNLLKFMSCNFLAGFYLSNGIRQDIEIKNLDFTDTVFKEKVKVKIQFCNIDEANFYNTKFGDLADFYQTKFKKVIFERTDFEKISVFSEVEFNCDVNFKYTKFLGKSIFRDTVITGILNLRDTIFDAEANFLDITSKCRKYKDKFVGEPTDIQVANRETARVIKNFYDSSNNIIEANRFYKLEMIQREYELGKDINKNFFELFIFKIHGWASNHSQSWLLALYWIIIVGVFAAFYDYYFDDKFQPIPYYNFFDILVGVILFGCISSIFNVIIPKYRVFFNTMLLTFLVIIYFISTKDYTFQYFSKTINPFSVMKSDADINGIQLFFKVIIAYLIYQLITSIRQNTRRK